MFDFNKSKPKFQIGNLVITKAASEVLNGTQVHLAVNLHQSGDWGDICESDRQSNENALVHGGRLMSVHAYNETGDVFWIITEADHSVTTVLLPDDY